MIKARVVGPLGLLVSSKLILIQVPFLFKHIVDELTLPHAAAAAELGVSATADPLLAVPLSLVVGYGIARSTALGFQELRNSIFATVSQKAIRAVARDIFVHLHSLDMNFHLNRQTGGLSRVIDRGSRSIQYTLSAMLFNVVPTALEISLVSAILTTKFGWQFAACTCMTIGSHAAFTIGITLWRTPFR
jgi:ABC-type multidrug transport system fused ATPase/permease subunit